MAKRNLIPLRPTYMHLSPALLQKKVVLQIVESEPTEAWWRNNLETDSPYAAYAEVEVIYAVLELLEVPISDASLSEYRVRARRSIEKYLAELYLR